MPKIAGFSCIDSTCKLTANEIDQIVECLFNNLESIKTKSSDVIPAEHSVVAIGRQIDTQVEIFLSAPHDTYVSFIVAMDTKATVQCMACIQKLMCMLFDTLVEIHPEWQRRVHAEKPLGIYYNPSKAWPRFQFVYRTTEGNLRYCNVGVEALKRILRAMDEDEA